MSNSSGGSPLRLHYGIDDVPPLGERMVLGFQHYVTMFGGTVAIPLILAEPLGMADDPVAVGWLIGTMFFVGGIATLLQTTWGTRLPIVQGGTFAFLAPTIAICGMASLADAGWQVKLQHIQGAIIGGAVFEMLIGATGVVGRLMRYITPITIAPTVGLVGLCLFKIGAPIAGTHWGIGGLTIAGIILCSQYLQRHHRWLQLFPVLFAVLAAWGAAGILTWLGVFTGPVMDGATGAITTAAHPAYVDMSRVADAPWLRVPMPFQWGWPTFGLAALVGMLAGYVASVVESVGDYYACARLAGAPTPTASTLNRGITIEGIGCLVAGIFGTGNGTTSYSENIGAIGITKVGSRAVVQTGAIIMIALGVVGKFGALFTTIPQPIVGGMYCAMFGMIAAVGLSNLQFVDLNSSRNLFIVGFSFFMGLSVPEYIAANPASVGPEWLRGIINTLGATGMAVGAFTALVLDNTIPGTDAERGMKNWLAQELSHTLQPGQAKAQPAPSVETA